MVENMKNDGVDLALSEILFKKVFSSKGNEHILAGLFGDFFGFTPEELRLTSPYNIDSFWQNHNDSEKAEREPMHSKDAIYAEFKNGDLVAEMQIGAKYVFESKSLLNAAHSFSANYNKNDDRHKSLRPVYSLNILLESIYHDDLAVRHFVMKDMHSDRQMNMNLISIVFFELGKEHVYHRNHGYWQMYFLNMPIPEEAPDYIKDAASQIKRENLSEEERKLLNRYERAGLSLEQAEAL